MVMHTAGAQKESRDVQVNRKPFHVAVESTRPSKINIVAKHQSLLLYTDDITNYVAQRPSSGYQMYIITTHAAVSTRVRHAFHGSAPFSEYSTT